MRVSSPAGMCCGSQAMSGPWLRFLRLRRLVLLAPARHLAFQVVTRLAVIAQADRLVIDRMQGGDDAVHLVENGAFLRRRHARQGGIPEYAALDVIHDVEGRTDDLRVLAQRVAPGHRHVGVRQRGDDAVFALHRVRRGQQLARRLAAHDVALAVRGANQVGWVGLTALELFDPAQSLETLDMPAHPRRQPLAVEGILRRDRPGADESLLAVVAHAGR